MVHYLFPDRFIRIIVLISVTSADFVEIVPQFLRSLVSLFFVRLFLDNRTNPEVCVGIYFVKLFFFLHAARTARPGGALETRAERRPGRRGVAAERRGGEGGGRNCEAEPWYVRK